MCLSAYYLDRDIHYILCTHIAPPALSHSFNLTFSGMLVFDISISQVLESHLQIVFEAFYKLHQYQMPLLR
ncbi:MAG: hypothetical protein ABFS56_33755, partial [Pseudomonadota bacterium]